MQDKKFDQKHWEERIEAKKGRKVSPLCPMCAGSLLPLVMGQEVAEVVQVPVVQNGKKGFLGAEFRILVCEDCGTQQRVHAAACTTESRIQVAASVTPIGRAH